jgi:hypothetical protein
MGAVVFDNFVFDSWLTKKSDDILSKVDREKISTEEMLVLILKAQTNHFHHMDVEFRQEFKRIDERFIALENRMDQKFDNKFDKMWNFLKWQGGIILALFAGLYLKLFLG